MQKPGTIVITSQKRGLTELTEMEAREEHLISRLNVYTQWRPLNRTYDGCSNENIPRNWQTVSVVLDWVIEDRTYIDPSSKDTV